MTLEIDIDESSEEVNVLFDNAHNIKAEYCVRRGIVYKGLAKISEDSDVELIKGICEHIFTKYLAESD